MFEITLKCLMFNGFLYLLYRYVLYCMKYVHMLLKYKIKPIMVFDGRRLPAKEQTEIKRKEYVKKSQLKIINYLNIFLYF